MILLFEPFILQNFRNFDPLQLSNILIRNLRTWQKWEMEKPKTHSKIYFIVKSYRQRIRIKNTFNQLLSTKWKTWRHYKASIMNLQPKNNPCQRFHFSVNKTCIKSNKSRNTHFLYKFMIFGSSKGKYPAISTKRMTPQDHISADVPS